MREVPAAEFTRNFGHYQEVVQREPLAVTRDGEPTGYFVSSEEFEELQRYRAMLSRSFATADLTHDEVVSIGSGHAFSPRPSERAAG